MFLLAGDETDLETTVAQRQRPVVTAAERRR